MGEYNVHFPNESWPACPCVSWPLCSSSSSMKELSLIANNELGKRCIQNTLWRSVFLARTRHSFLGFHFSRRWKKSWSFFPQSTHLFFFIHITSGGNDTVTRDKSCIITREEYTATKRLWKRVAATCTTLQNAARGPKRGESDPSGSFRAPRWQSPGVLVTRPRRPRQYLRCNGIRSFLRRRCYLLGNSRG